MADDTAQVPSAFASNPLYSELWTQGTAQGYTPTQIAASIASASAESGGRTNGPAGDNGTSIGSFQWHNERGTAMRNWAKDQGLDPSSPQAQAGFHYHELATTERAAGNRLRNAQDEYSAAHALAGYERPAGWKGWNADPSTVSRWDKRLGATRQFAQAAGAGGMVPYAGPGNGPTQVAGGPTLGPTLPQDGLLDQGILAAAQQDQQKQGILSQAAQDGGGSGALLAAMQKQKDQGVGGPVSPIPSVALAANGPLPPGMIPNPPITNPGLGVGGANPQSLPTMALNPSAMGGNPTEPGAQPVGTPGGPTLGQMDQPGSLQPSSPNTPPSLALNRPNALAPIVPPVQEGRSVSAAVAPPPGSNPAAPGFAGGVGGFFDRLQNSGIGDSLTRAGAALMARDNPSGAAALLGGISKKKASDYGTPYQKADGSWVRDVTDGETGKPTTVAVNPSTVDQKLVDAAQARQLAMAKVKADTEKSLNGSSGGSSKLVEQTPDAEGKYDRTRAGWKDENGLTYQSPEPALRKATEGLLAGISFRDMTSNNKELKRDLIPYLDSKGVDMVGITQAAADQKYRMTEAAKLGAISATGHTSVAGLLADTNILTERLAALQKVLPDTGIVPLNQAAQSIARLGGPGGPELAQVEEVMMAAKQHYVQLLRQTGVNDVNSQKKADDMFHPGMTVPQMQSVISTLRSTAQRELKARDEVNDNTRRKNTGQEIRYPEHETVQDTPGGTTPKAKGSLFDHIMGQ